MKCFFHNSPVFYDLKRSHLGEYYLISIRNAAINQVILYCKIQIMLDYKFFSKRHFQCI